MGHRLGISDLIMKTQTINLAGPRSAHKSESQITDYTLKKIEQYGFNYFHFKFSPRFTSMPLLSNMLSNYPNEFIKTFERTHYTHKNPIIAHCHFSISPIAWDDELFCESPEIWQECQAHGLKHGWSQSVHDASGGVSILSLARSYPPLTEDEFTEKAANVLWLCNQLHSFMSARSNPRLRELPPISRLSIRESEVLKWTAEGKTASDIAMILSLTTRTVNFHISSAIRKMGANNKTSAVVIATKSGLL